MAVNNMFVLGLYTYNCFYTEETNIEREYKVTFDFLFPSDPTELDHWDLMDTFANFVANMLFNHMVVKRVSASTWEKDSNPYEGTEFITKEYSLRGVRFFSASQVLPAEVCLYLKKNTVTGRNGKMFLRGTVLEEDVSYATSGFAMNDRATYESLLENALSISGLNAYIGGDSTSIRAVVATSVGNVLYPRTVTDLVLAGVRTVNISKRRKRRT